MLTVQQLSGMLGISAVIDIWHHPPWVCQKLEKNARDYAASHQGTSILDTTNFVDVADDCLLQDVDDLPGTDDLPWIELLYEEKRWLITIVVTVAHHNCSVLQKIHWAGSNTEAPTVWVDTPSSTGKSMVIRWRGWTIALNNKLA